MEYPKPEAHDFQVMQPVASEAAASKASPYVEPSEGIASYSRKSSGKQPEESLIDQQRKCREAAAKNGHVISPDLEYLDSGVSGTKREREGLNALLESARQGRIKVLYLFCLSRLARESAITIPLLKDLVHNLGVRVICISEGIDTKDSTWEIMTHVMSIVNQQFLGELAAHVFRGQEGIVLNGHCVGDTCFGYSSEAIPDSENSGGKKRQKPLKMYVIEPERAQWVMRIFDWFVRDRRSISCIVRELNRLGAPKDHRSTTEEWRHAYVLRLLSNRKYVGIWPWGEKKNVRDPLTGIVRQVDRSYEEYKDWVRDFPHLRLIDDETFEKAQKILEQNQKTYAEPRRKNGKLKGSTSKAHEAHPRHMLSQLVVCSHCGKIFNVGGTGSQRLFCPSHKMGKCDCKTQLRRDLAESMILDAVGCRILEDPVWADRVYRETEKAWNSFEATLPNELKNVRRKLTQVGRKIDRLLDSIEEGDDDPDVKKRLSARRQERVALERQLKRLESADQERPEKPTKSWVEEQLRSLGETLSQGGPAAAHALRALVGGEIRVLEVREEGRQRFYLRGCFTITTRNVAAALSCEIHQDPSDAPALDDQACEEIVIDFIPPNPLDAQADEAKALYDQGLKCKEIGKRLGVSKSSVTKRIKHWFESRGLEMPDGRARWHHLEDEQTIPPVYKERADDVMRLVEADLSNRAIGRELKMCDLTVQKSIDWWCDEHGVPRLTAELRREKMLQAAKKMYDEYVPIKTIAEKFSYSTRGMKLALEQHMASLGETMGDSRSRNGRYRLENQDPDSASGGTAS